MVYWLESIFPQKYDSLHDFKNNTADIPRKHSPSLRLLQIGLSMQPAFLNPLETFTWLITLWSALQKKEMKQHVDVPLETDYADYYTHENLIYILFISNFGDTWMRFFMS